MILVDGNRYITDTNLHIYATSIAASYKRNGVIIVYYHFARLMAAESLTAAVTDARKIGESVFLRLEADKNENLEGAKRTLTINTASIDGRQYHEVYDERDV